MHWREFKSEAPEIASHAEKLFDEAQIVLLGTIRKDGSPRISPVEFIFLDGKLYLGMMWESMKALDLLRDPRCTIHSAVTNRHATGGEFKLHGRAIDVQDAEERSRYCKAVLEKLGWDPGNMKFHLFSVEATSAGLFTTANNARRVRRWRASEGVSDFQQTA